MKRAESPDRTVTVISFGYGHGAPPEAHATFDVRHHFKDPHVNPALRDLTAADPAVVETVLSTSGIPALIDSITSMARAFRAAPSPRPLTIAVGCVGGRHRSVVIAAEVARRMDLEAIPAILSHRDISRPVIARRPGFPEPVLLPNTTSCKHPAPKEQPVMSSRKPMERKNAVTPEQMLREFHTAKNVHNGRLPERPTTDIPDQVRNCRFDLLAEEVRELHDAMIAGDIVGIADGVADVVFVTVGTAVTYGIPFDAVFREVFRSNMTKVNPDPLQTKLVKGPGYESPRITEILTETGGTGASAACGQA